MLLAVRTKTVLWDWDLVERHKLQRAVSHSSLTEGGHPSGDRTWVSSALRQGELILTVNPSQLRDNARGCCRLGCPSPDKVKQIGGWLISWNWLHLKGQGSDSGGGGGGGYPSPGLERYPNPSSLSWGRETVRHTPPHPSHNHTRHPRHPLISTR